MSSAFDSMVSAFLSPAIEQAHAERTPAGEVDGAAVVLYPAGGGDPVELSAVVGAVTSRRETVEFGSSSERRHDRDEVTIHLQQTCAELVMGSSFGIPSLGDSKWSVEEFSAEVMPTVKLYRRRFLDSQRAGRERGTQ